NHINQAATFAINRRIFTYKAADGVQHLLRLLTCVSRSGWESGFRESVLPRWGKKHPYTEPLLSMRHALEDAKGFMTALNKVNKNLGKEIRNLQQCCTPLVLEDGIQRLPDEILGHIFEIGHAMTYGCQFGLAVSRVSCRFRNISLALPRLWSRISSYDEGSKIRMLLSRSRHCGLDIIDDNTDLGAIPSLAMEFWKVLGPLSSRWVTLNLSENGTDTLRNLQIRNFPSLREVHLPSFKEAELSTWSIPALSSIYDWDLCFPLLNKGSLQSQLTSMVLYVSSDIDIMALFQGLIGLKALQDLSMHLFGGLATEPGQLDPSEIPEPHSIPIDILRLHVCDSPSQLLVVAIYDILSIYKATQVHHSITQCKNPDTLEHYLLNSKKELFPYGSTIQMKVEETIDISYILKHIAKNCKIAQTVHLELPLAHAGFMANQKNMYILPFNRLLLENCDSLTEQDVVGLAKAVLHSKGLEFLKIITCKQVSDDFLLHLQDAVGPKLQWSLYLREKRKMFKVLCEFCPEQIINSTLPKFSNGSKPSIRKAPQIFLTLSEFMKLLFSTNNSIVFSIICNHAKDPTGKILGRHSLELYELHFVDNNKIPKCLRKCFKWDLLHLVLRERGGLHFSDKGGGLGPVAVPDLSSKSQTACSGIWKLWTE
ncbi:hypothetical protein BD410DRAFT_810578, partial [Rickenella mellea]